ncbi:hypothetical protein ABW20_dc0100800 [Dactylellina cionopaga]|nr:hypothetical protein ABW20_dc0100800 [Dactylellina cionopaga]
MYNISARLLTARSKVPALAFFLGIFLGYTVSTKKIYVTQPFVSTNNPIPLQQVATIWGGDDLYFYPPLDQKRYPVVPAYNDLPETFQLLVSAQKLIPQSPLTPLFVPFTRNSLMLRQTVLSYIAAGWPRDQIYIIDNSGTMDANYHSLLSSENPFFVDYNLFRGRYGVNIIRTPTLLSFAQLQNYMLSTAMNRNWTHYYWTHQDVAVLSDERRAPYRSLYHKVLFSLISLFPNMASEEAVKEGKRWGMVFYDFDWLTLVNVGAAADRNVGVGSWDTFIPYYNTDCDYYERMRLMGFPILERRVGQIYDLAGHVENPEYAFFGMTGRPAATGDSREDLIEELGSQRYIRLKKQLQQMMKEKNNSGRERNTWQTEQIGGKGEPWTYDPKGFQIAWWDMTEEGRLIYSKKWGTTSCTLIELGKDLRSMWTEADDERELGYGIGNEMGMGGEEYGDKISGGPLAEDLLSNGGFNGNMPLNGVPGDIPFDDNSFEERIPRDGIHTPKTPQFNGDMPSENIDIVEGASRKSRSKPQNNSREKITS